LTVSNVWITDRNASGGYLCLVAIELSSEQYRFQINGLRIVETNKGVIVAMPSRRSGTKWVDLVHPCNQHTRDLIERAVLDHYKNNIEND